MRDLVKGRYSRKAFATVANSNGKFQAGGTHNTVFEGSPTNIVDNVRKWANGRKVRIEWCDPTNHYRTINVTILNDS